MDDLLRDLLELVIINRDRSTRAEKLIIMDDICVFMDEML